MAEKVADFFGTDFSLSKYLLTLVSCHLRLILEILEEICYELLLVRWLARCFNFLVHVFQCWLEIFYSKLNAIL